MENLNRRTGIEFELVPSGDCINLLPHLSSNIYRVFQEIITNVTRHSEATRLEVALETDDKNFEMTILDNGIGIKYSQIKSRNSFGILGMQERIAATGGKFHVKKSRQGGTQVEVKVR